MARCVPDLYQNNVGFGAPYLKENIGLRGKGRAFLPIYVDRMRQAFYFCRISWRDMCTDLTLLYPVDTQFNVLSYPESMPSLVDPVEIAELVGVCVEPVP